MLRRACFPTCVLMYSATTPVSTHDTKQFTIQSNLGLLTGNPVHAQSLLAGFLHDKAALRAEPELVHTRPYKAV